MKRRTLLLGALALGTRAWAGPADQAPALLLARPWQSGTDLADWWVSEKDDGVRGFWDGSALRTRGGERIAAPPWFTAGWPATPLDGELWAGRGGFEQAQSAVARQSPDDAAWRRLRYMVFDLPAHPGTFDQRLPALRATVAAMDQPWVQAVPQRRVASQAQLQALLRQVVAGGGEGLMLHRGSSHYRAGRDDARLGVFVRFELEQIVAAARAVQRIAAVQHQPLAAATHHLAHQRLQLGVAAHLALRHRLHPGLVDGGHQAVQLAQAFVEAAGVGRQVEHHVAQAAPLGVVGLLARHGGLRLLKATAPGPQLAVQRRGGPAGGEPGRRGNRLAAARAQLAAVPVSTHTVVLFADLPVAQVDAGAVAPGQKQRRSLGPRCTDAGRRQQCQRGA